MVKAFEDEVFSMQPKEIRGPIETLFGFHIIKLAEIKSADVASFNEVVTILKRCLNIRKHQKNLVSLLKISGISFLRKTIHYR